MTKQRRGKRARVETSQSDSFLAYMMQVGAKARAVVRICTCVVRFPKPHFKIIIIKKYFLQLFKKEVAFYFTVLGSRLGLYFAYFRTYLETLFPLFALDLFYFYCYC